MAADLSAIAARYRRFADDEAAGVSPTYARLATAAANDAQILEFLATLPYGRQQPNLFLAAVRHLAGVPPDAAALAQVVHDRADELRHVMRSRLTQTNEPARCAVLLPVLARLPQPLALIEVGASAGLCLLPDRYAYDYSRVTLTPANRPDAPVLPCEANATTPLPDRLPDVAWRAGLDLNPIDLDDTDQVAWLRTLVWPEQADRRARLDAAIAVARADPPRVVAGNLLTDLAPLIAEAPADATVVVFHSSVLNYLPDDAQRQRFAATVSASGAVWVSNESPAVFPAHAAAAPPAPRGKMLLAVDSVPVAWTGPHGQSIDWFA